VERARFVDGFELRVVQLGGGWCTKARVAEEDGEANGGAKVCTTWWWPTRIRRDRMDVALRRFRCLSHELACARRTRR